MDANLNIYFNSGTSLVLTVVRSIGNSHGHLGTWCWAQSGRTGKVGNFESPPSKRNCVFSYIWLLGWVMTLQLECVLHWKRRIVGRNPNGNLWTFLPSYLLFTFRNAVLNLTWNLLTRNKFSIFIYNSHTVGSHL